MMLSRKTRPFVIDGPLTISACEGVHGSQVRVRHQARSIDDLGRIGATHIHHKGATAMTKPIVSFAGLLMLMAALVLVTVASVATAEPERRILQPDASPQKRTGWPDKPFTVDAAGNISPQMDYLHSGQRAVWTFATASPANALVRQTGSSTGHAAAPYDPNYVNEFMTPLPKGMSGIFVISDNQGGFVEQPAPCANPAAEQATRDVDGTTWHLCATHPDRSSPQYQATMDTTWANPAITGVFIRLKWSDLQTGPTTYDDTILLREVDKAVANGKLYSIAIKSGAENDATPRWLFSPAPAGAGLTPVRLDWNESSPSCGASPHDYGDPTDPVYRDLYLDMLSHVASVLKENSARWRSLANLLR